MTSTARYATKLARVPLNNGSRSISDTGGSKIGSAWAKRKTDSPSSNSSSTDKVTGAKPQQPKQQDIPKIIPPPSFLTKDPKEIELARQQILSQRERASKVYKELENVVVSQQEKHFQEKKKRFRFSGLFDFFRKYKSNITAITVSFITVILALQIVSFKQQYSVSEEKRKQLEHRLKEQRNLLRRLITMEEVSSSAKDDNNETTNNNGNEINVIASDCADYIINDIINDNMKSKQNQKQSLSSLLSKLLFWIEQDEALLSSTLSTEQDEAKNKNNVDDPLKEKIVNDIQIIIQQRLQQIIGDSAYDEDELKAKALQDIMTDHMQKQQTTGGQFNKTDNSIVQETPECGNDTNDMDQLLKDLQLSQLLEEEVITTDDGTKIVKKKVFSL